MKYLRSVLIVALLLLVALSVSAQKKVTVSFMCIEADLPKDFVDSFMKANPDINLVRLEEDWTKWVADSMAGTAADLIRLGVGTDTAYYSRRGMLYDMTKLMQGSKIVKMDDIDKFGSSSYQTDGTNFGTGKWYGLPKDYNNIGVITYNKKFFKEAGLAPLSLTEPIGYYDDVYNLAKKLVKKDAAGKVSVWGTEFLYSWIPFLVSDMATSSGLSFYADAKKSKMNNDQKMRDLWKYWTRFSVEDISSNVRNPNTGWAGTAFQSDRVGFVQLGYWYGAQLTSEKDYNERFAWAPTPILRKGAKRATNTLGATGVVMYAKTKNPKQAFRVWEWYMGGEYGIHRAKTGWGIPPLLSLRKYLPEDNEYNRSRKQIAFDDAKYFVPWQANPYLQWQQLNAPWAAHIEELVTGKIKTDQFIDKYFAEVNESIATGMSEVGD